VPSKNTITIRSVEQLSNDQIVFQCLSRLLIEIHDDATVDQVLQDPIVAK